MLIGWYDYVDGIKRFNFQKFIVDLKVVIYNFNTPTSF